MGLLTQMLGGALEQGGNTAAAMMLENQRQGYQTERDKAQALREENLARLRQSLSDQSAEKAHGRALSASFDPDTNRQLTNEEAAGYEPDTLIGAHQAQQNTTVNPTYVINGHPATNQQISDNQAANENMGLIKTAQQRRAADALTGAQKDGPPTPGAVSAAGDAGNPTPEEQDIAESWKADAGKLSNTKETALEAKLEAQAEQNKQKSETQLALMQMKIDNAAALAQMKWDSAKELLQAKLAAGHTQESEEIKRTLAEIKQADSQRKAADSAAKLLDKTGGTMDADQTRLYNSFLKMAGAEEEAKPIPEPTAKKESKGLIATVKEAFGGSKAPVPSTKGPTVMVYKNGKLQPK